MFWIKNFVDSSNFHVGVIDVDFIVAVVATTVRVGVVCLVDFLLSSFDETIFILCSTIRLNVYFVIGGLSVAVITNQA